MAPAQHVVFGRDLRGNRGTAPPGARALQEVVEELPAQAEADARDRHNIFGFGSPEHVPAPQLASTLLALGFGFAAVVPWTAGCFFGGLVDAVAAAGVAVAAGVAGTGAAAGGSAAAVTVVSAAVDTAAGAPVVVDAALVVTARPRHPTAPPRNPWPSTTR